MRRVIAGFVTSTVLLLTLAAPVLGAPPIREDGTVTFANAFSSACETTGGGGQTCTDTFVDSFQVAPDLWVVCVGRFSYAIAPNGRFRQISNESGCTELAANPLTIAADFLSASLSPTQVTLFSCNRQGCTEGDTVNVSVEWTSTGQIFEFSNRGTFRDGTCTFRFSSSGKQSEGTADITLDSSTIGGNGFYSMEEFRISQHC